jgi:hypothetical protein
MYLVSCYVLRHVMDKNTHKYWTQTEITMIGKRTSLLMNSQLSFLKQSPWLSVNQRTLFHFKDRGAIALAPRHSA